MRLPVGWLSLNSRCFGKPNQQVVELKDFHPEKPGSMTLPHIRELPSGASASVPWIMLKKWTAWYEKGLGRSLWWKKDLAYIRALSRVVIEDKSNNDNNNSNTNHKSSYYLMSACFLSGTVLSTSRDMSFNPYAIWWDRCLEIGRVNIWPYGLIPELPYFTTDDAIHCQLVHILHKTWLQA